MIRQKSPSLRVDTVGAEQVQAALRDAGIECQAREDEAILLWERLVFLAPIALATAAFDAVLGEVRDTAEFTGCRTEAAVAANAAGARIEVQAIQSLHTAAPPQMQSSMQKDLAAGREPELSAIAGPILRLGEEHQFPTTCTQNLVNRITARLARAK